MKGKYILFALVLTLCSVVPVWADDIPKDLTAALPEEARQLSDEAGGGTYDHTSLLHAAEELGARIRTGIVEGLRARMGTAVMILAVVLLCGLADELRPSGVDVGENYTVIAGALTIVMISAGDVRALIGTGLEAMEQLDIFAKALLPTLAAAVAAGGGAVSAGTGQVATVFFTNTLLTLIRHVMLPLVYFYIAVVTADAVLPEHELERFGAGLKKLITWTLTALLLLFTGFLTLIGVTGSSADAVALRLTRSAISSAVPVVGGVISGAADSVLASAGILKNAIGVYGMLGIVAVCLAPFIQLAVQYLLYKLTAFLVSVVGRKPLVGLVDALGGAFGLVLGMMGACALMLLIAVASFVSVMVV